MFTLIYSFSYLRVSTVQGYDKPVESFHWPSHCLLEKKQGVNDEDTEEEVVEEEDEDQCLLSVSTLKIHSLIIKSRKQMLRTVDFLLVLHAYLEL